MNISSFSPSDFDGHTRLFPLPNLVMFPYALQSLHIFEPRFVAMFEECLASDRLFAIGLLDQGWEDDYQGRPTVCETVCLCQVVTHEQRPDQLYDTIVFGISRARILRELKTNKPFREIEVELLEDQISGPLPTRQTLEKQLVALVDQLMPGNAAMIRQLQEQSAPEATLSILTDLLAYSLPLAPERKQELLSETTVSVRAEQILDLVPKSEPLSAKPGHRFPPDFSAN
ncbi:MAG: LON peptidase substrate-binding domain-containing protein [Planctomycetota bacterium]